VIHFISQEIALALHSRYIETFGGSDGIRDKGLLESALNNPKNVAHYESAALPELAAVLCYAIVKNHPFVDGNKRTGFGAMQVFLGLNGLDLVASDVDAIAIIIAVASGDVERDGLAKWIQDNTQKLR
jgi:death on curing protein